MTWVDKITLTLKAIAIWPLKMVIRAYQVCISPLLPASCRFYPTCSHYAAEALTVHGPIKGSFLAARRILRCHPIESLGGGSGFDPVPPGPSKQQGQIAPRCDHMDPHHLPQVRD